MNGGALNFIQFEVNFTFTAFLFERLKMYLTLESRGKGSNFR